MSRVRRRTAENMARAWATIPQVTQFDRADITELETFRKASSPRVDEAGGKLTLTALMVKVVASLLGGFPRFNASLDPSGEEIILKKYVNIGVAVDTERGLLVPVIHGADGKSLLRIAVELNGLAEKARARKATREELSGASFTVTNLGGLGTTYFSPIVNWPETAILGVGRARQEPVYANGEFHPRLILPLSISYDHRVIDGADAARFLRRLAESLENPLLLLLEA
jgi:pyruvate dehydrogenase E2 component (dihydrolipoamide acetyltransferase)